MSDISGSDKVMSISEEARTVVRNSQGDPRVMSEYTMSRCADFTFDHERELFIREMFIAIRNRVSLPASTTHA
jgi:hypothetical protein